MENKGFRYSFTLPELKFFLFGKKICPQCNSKLVRKKSFVIRTDLFHNDGSDPFFHPGQKVKCYSYFYNCNNCGFQSELSDMVKKN